MLLTEPKGKAEYPGRPAMSDSLLSAIKSKSECGVEVAVAIPELRSGTYFPDCVLERRKPADQH